MHHQDDYWILPGGRQFDHEYRLTQQRFEAIMRAPVSSEFDEMVALKAITLPRELQEEIGLDVSATPEIEYRLRFSTIFDWVYWDRKGEQRIDFLLPIYLGALGLNLQAHNEIDGYVWANPRDIPTTMRLPDNTRARLQAFLRGLMNPHGSEWINYRFRPFFNAPPANLK